MERLAILGASGHGKVVADTAELTGWKVVDFFDDAFPAKIENGRWKILGDSNALLTSIQNYDGVIVAIGDNRVRELKTNLLIKVSAPFAKIIHPSAQISSYVKIGLGSVVFAHVSVNCDAQIGCSAILNTSCSIDHDCCLGDFVHISPGARLAGNVTIGHRSWVGIGASVKNGVIIGDDAVIGAGAVVIKTVFDKTVVKGVPAS